MQLAQARFLDHFTAAGISDNLRGVTGTPQITGDDMCDPFFAHTLRHLTGLKKTFCR